MNDQIVGVTLYVYLGASIALFVTLALLGPRGIAKIWRGVISWCKGDKPTLEDEHVTQHGFDKPARDSKGRFIKNKRRK